MHVAIPDFDQCSNEEDIFDFAYAINKLKLTCSRCM